MLAVGGRALLVIGDHFAGAQALGADLLDAEDLVELPQATAQVGPAGRAPERGGQAMRLRLWTKGKRCPRLSLAAKAPRPAHSPLRSFATARPMTTLTLLQARAIARCRARRRPPGRASAHGRGRARRFRPHQGGAARRRRQHVPGRHRQRQGLGGDRHGRGQPDAGAARPRTTRTSSSASPRRRRDASCRRPARC